MTVGDEIKALWPYGRVRHARKGGFWCDNCHETIARREHYFESGESTHYHAGGFQSDRYCAGCAYSRELMAQRFERRRARERVAEKGA